MTAYEELVDFLQNAQHIYSDKGKERVLEFLSKIPIGLRNEVFREFSGNSAERPTLRLVNEDKSYGLNMTEEEYVLGFRDNRTYTTLIVDGKCYTIDIEASTKKYFTRILIGQKDFGHKNERVEHIIYGLVITQAN